MSRVAAAFYSQPWALQPEKLEAVAAVVERHLLGVSLSAEELAAKLSPAKVASTARRAGAVAVIPVLGVISHRMGMLSESSGGTSTERLSGAIRAAVADPEVKAIVLDVDSPGGSVAGVPELAAEIFAARGKKPIVAVANALAASAAYWLASQADEIVATPSAMVGSIGVYTVHQDHSAALAAEGVKTTIVKAGKYKADGNPTEPLSEDAAGRMQRLVDAAYELFVNDVARGRGVKASEVRAGYGEGAVLAAADAKSAGLVDRIETLAETLTRLGVQSPAAPMRAAAELDLLERELAL